MQELLDTILAALEQAGIRAQAALPFRVFPRLKAPMTAVRVEKARAAEAGMGRYLGEADDPETGRRAVYGRRLEAEISFRVASPAGLGGQRCFQEANALMDVLLGGMEGIAVGELSQAACTYDRDTDLFVCTVRAEIRARMCLDNAAAEPEMTDVVVNGGI